jgi:hypothetical protein
MISFSACLFFIYRKAADFCMWILYSATLSKVPLFLILLHQLPRAYSFSSLTSLTYFLISKECRTSVTWFCEKKKSEFRQIRGREKGKEGYFYMSLNVVLPSLVTLELVCVV